MRSKALTGRWLRRLVIIGVVVEVSWLVLVNAALRLPPTQSVINSIRPDKFQVSWQKVWTWYPARFEVTGAFANGQSRSQQWQFEAPFVAGSVALLPLILKRVSVSIEEAQSSTIAETGSDGVIYLNYKEGR